MHQVKKGRSGKQEQQQNSPNLGNAEPYNLKLESRQQVAPLSLQSLSEEEGQPFFGDIKVRWFLNVR